jgi:hypothetical protein
MLQEKNTPPDPYQQLIAELAAYSAAKARLGKLEAQTNVAYLALVDGTQPAYVAAQETLLLAEQAIKALVARHPEWFAEAKTLKTPFGQVHSHKATSHTAAIPELSIAKIRTARDLAQKFRAEEQSAKLDALIRVEESLNFEAMAAFTDRELLLYGIQRTTDESVTIKEAKVSLGQAIKAAAKQEQKTAKPAKGAKAGKREAVGV